MYAWTILYALRSLHHDRKLAVDLDPHMAIFIGSKLLISTIIIACQLAQASPNVLTGVMPSFGPMSGESNLVIKQMMQI